MATKQSTIDFLVDQLAGVAGVTTKRMFGEYCLYVAGNPIGFVCDDQLFLKPTEGARRLIGTVVEGQAYPGSKPYWLITADQWDDGDWLGNVIRVTAAELPPAKPRPKKKPVAKTAPSAKPRARSRRS